MVDLQRWNNSNINFLGKKKKQEKGMNAARIFKKTKMEDNCALELQSIGIEWVWLWNYRLQNETIQKNCSKYLPFLLEEAQGWVSILSRRDDTGVRIFVFTWLWEWDSELWNYNFRQLGGACATRHVDMVRCRHVFTLIITEHVSIS